MNSSADKYRPIQELEVKRLAFEFLNNTAEWDKFVHRYSASSTVAIACALFFPLGSPREIS